MTNSEALWSYLKKYNITLEEISAELGISRDKLLRKLNGQEEFRASEIKKFVNKVPMSEAEVQACFFAEDVTQCHEDKN